MSTKSIFSGAIFTVAMRWSDRLIGLASMIILARLLTPADFGLVAMASVVVGLVDVFLDLGTNTALIHDDKAGRDDFNTAWTLRLMQTTLGGIVVFLGAPLAAEYYHNPEVADVLHVMAITVFVAGLENIGIVTFQKNLEFGNDFRFFFFRRLAGFLTTLLAAWLLRSYWAMVYGAIMGRLVGVLLSYRMHPFRPRFSLARFSHLWSFSQWVLVRNVGAYLDGNTDKLLVGRRTDAAIAGAYAVAQDVAVMPTTELLAPLGRVLFPAFVQKRGDPEGFARSLATSIGVQALVAIPACVGLAMVAGDVVHLVLGAKWAQSAPLIRIMAFTNLLIALTHAGGYALLATGKVRWLALVSWLQALSFLAAAIFGFPEAGAAETALLRLATVAGGTLITTLLLLVTIKRFGPRSYLSAVIRPLLASAAMAGLLSELDPWLATAIPPLRLAAEVGAGVMAYATCTILLWLLSGRPEGAEAYLLKNLRRRTR
jgi:lipopolysaccharide exporter